MYRGKVCTNKKLHEQVLVYSWYECMHVHACVCACVYVWNHDKQIIVAYTHSV